MQPRCLVALNIKTGPFFTAIRQSGRTMTTSANTPNGAPGKIPVENVPFYTLTDGADFSVFAAKLKRRLSFIVKTTLLIALICAFIGLAYSQLRTPSYSATSELLISNTSLQLSGQEAVVTQVLVDSSLLESQIELLKSGRVLERTVDREGLDTVEKHLMRVPDVRGTGSSSAIESVSKLFGTHSDDKNAAIQNHRQAVLAGLKSALTVKRLGATQIISVHATARTPEGSTFLANAIARSFVIEQEQTNALVTTSAAFRERIRVIGPTARIINDAIAPSFKDGPGRLTATFAVGMAGGVLGALAALMMVFLDRRIISERQVVLATGTEYFGEIPELKPSSPSVPRQPLRRARLAAIESYGKVPKLIGVTSIEAGAGKTMLAASLARLVAEDGQKVLLVDADHYNPEISRRLGTGNSNTAEAGLRQVLTGRTRFSEVVRRNIGHWLDFLPHGQGNGGTDAGWVEFFGDMHGDETPYSWIIVDLPPIKESTVVRSAGAVLDGLLLVIESCTTLESAVEHSLQSLGPVRQKLLGTILNNVPDGINRRNSEPAKAELPKMRSVPKESGQPSGNVVAQPYGNPAS